MSYSSIGQVTVALRALGLEIEEVLPELECRVRDTDLILLYRAGGDDPANPALVGLTPVSGGRVIGYINHGSASVFQMYLIVNVRGNGIVHGSQFNQDPASPTPPHQVISDFVGKRHVPSLWELADPGSVAALIEKLRNHLDVEVGCDMGREIVIGPRGL